MQGEKPVSRNPPGMLIKGKTEKKALPNKSSFQSQPSPRSPRPLSNKQRYGIRTSNFLDVIKASPALEKLEIEHLKRVSDLHGRPLAPLNESVGCADPIGYSGRLAV